MNLRQSGQKGEKINYAKVLLKVFLCNFYPNISKVICLWHRKVSYNTSLIKLIYSKKLMNIKVRIHIREKYLDFEFNKDQVYKPTVSKTGTSAMG